MEHIREKILVLENSSDCFEIILYDGSGKEMVAQLGIFFDYEEATKSFYELKERVTREEILENLK